MKGRLNPGCAALLLATLLFVSVCEAAPEAPGDCPESDNMSPPLSYSLADVRVGRIPSQAALARTLVALGGALAEVAIVSEAARDSLGEGWPPFPPQSRIMLVSLDTGRRVWEWPSTASSLDHETDSADAARLALPGAPAVLVGANGLAERLYLGDSAGQVWRLDFPSVRDWEEAASQWRVRLLADLALPFAPGAVQFTLAPDLVRGVDTAGRPFDGLLLVSQGSATMAADVSNGLYFLRDYAVQVKRSDDPLPAVVLRADLSLAAAAPDTGEGAGWFAPFRDPLEVARLRPLTDGGRVFLVTARVASSCEPPLILNYLFRLSDGRPLAYTPPGSVAGTGWLHGPRLEGREIVMPGRGLALPTDGAGGVETFRTRFRAEGIFTVVRYWRDLLLDAS